MTEEVMEHRLINNHRGQERCPEDSKLTESIAAAAVPFAASVSLNVFV